MKTILKITALLLLVLSAACGPASGPVSLDVPHGPAAWIDAPLDNSTLPQAEYQVVSHASDPGGIASFELKVNGQVLSTDPVPGDQAGQAIAHISQPWLPPAPGTYLLEVRAKNTSGEFGPSASANVTVGGAAATVTPEVTATASIPVAVGLQPTNCRYGPGNDYDVAGTLHQDQSVEIVGINAEKTYVLVKHPNFDTGRCWVLIKLIRVIGDPNTLPVIPAPPLPTPKPGHEATATPEHH